ncbi:TonB-dependent receptor [Alteraurantiacibacter buctensis]|uniref:TonB-dependent receptor n=1 Tax=Alteraurantiacibacter buctensis TaxID=1503981 RepID=A0A844YXP9_9SPHN|nr:TonB-dependent receptor [Alteraurantiacibacter buctensis]MXO71806.1 TonB-dependent receptor [Alteraurantiacibacter buctensis]
MKKLLLVGSILGAGLLPNAAMAQAGPNPEEASRGSGTQARVADDNVIMVTAQRREESLQDAAIPIVAATGEQLSRAGVADVTQLGKVAPSLNIVNQAGSATSFFIRGVGNFNNNNLSDPAVAFNFDGVYVGRPSSTAAFMDVQRVEVLKGPQGTLYGRNATGGAINVIPVHPELGEFGGFVHAGYGNHDSYELSGAINAPLGDSVALRLSGIINGHDGYFADGTGDAENLALRGQIYAEISPAVDVRVLAEYSTRGGNGPGGNLIGAYQLTPNVFLPPNTPTTIPNWTYTAAPASVAEPFSGLYTPQSLAYLGQFLAAPLFSRANAPAYPSIDDEIWGVNAEFNVDLGAAQFTLIPAYRKQELHNIYSLGIFQGALQDETAEQVSLEARLAGSVGLLDYVTGLFYYNEKTTFRASFNQWSLQNNGNARNETESMAAFARLVANVTDQLRIVGGIRYTDDQKSIDATQPSLAAICVAATPNCSTVPSIPFRPTIEESIAAINPALFVSGLTPLQVPLGVPVPYFADPSQPAIMIRGNTIVKDESSFSRVTWRGALEYDLSDDNLLYASYESGYRSGGFNITFGRENYGPEYLDAYTVGSKNVFFDGLLQLNIEGFIWKYRDQQVSHIGLDLSGASAFFTENIGRSTLQGIDVDFALSPTESTTISGSVQYLDASNDAYVYQVPDTNTRPAPFNFVTPLVGCPYTGSTVQTSRGPLATYAVNCSGTRPINAPAWTARLGLEQVVELGELSLVGNVDGFYRSTRELTISYLPTSRSGEDLTLDASLTLRPADENWFVTAYVRNLTNEDVLTNYTSGTPNVISVSYEAPRTFGVRAGFDF